MKRALIALSLVAAPLPALAQHDHGASPPAQEDHSAHQGHAMPAGPPAPTPQPPGAHAADAIFDPAAMARARAALVRESGGMTHAMLLVDRLEWQAREGADGYAWEGEAWVGGDIDRLTIKSEGEGVAGGRLESAEVQALWSHAVDPWWNLQLGVRQDIRPTPARSYVAAGIEGLAPYWFKVAAALFLSDKGRLTARVEASHDIRLTQRLLLTPRAEVNLATRDSVLREAELGMRLGYMIEPRFTPYVGVEWSGVRGPEAMATDDRNVTRFVTGLRFWF